MTFINRAFLNIIRKPGKTVMLLLLVFLLSVLLSAAISIGNAIYQTESNLRIQLPSVATLDWEFRSEGYFDGETVHFEFPTVDMINDVGNLPYVKDYDFRSESWLHSRDLEWVLPSINQDLIPEGLTENELKEMQTGFREAGAHIEKFPVMGINNPNPTELQSGLISLASGRFMTQEELDRGAPVAVVSSLFAEVNDLHVGSTLILENNVYDDAAMLEEGLLLNFLYWHLDDFVLGHQLIEFEVIGIFNIDKPFLYPDDIIRTWTMTRLVAELYNQIYIPHRLQEEMANFILQYRSDFFGEHGTEEHPLVLQPMFVLHDPRDFDAFAEAAVSILPEHWNVYDTSSAFGPFISSMDTMLWIAQLIFGGTVIAKVAILSLVITLFLRDRKHEMGVYLVLGDRKGKILAQIISEVLSISIIAITLALFTGNILSSVFSRQILEQDLIRQEQENAFAGVSDGMPWELLLFDPGPISVSEMMTAYDTSLDNGTIIIFFGIGIGTVLISTVVPILYLVRLNPRKILM